MDGWDGFFDGLPTIKIAKPCVGYLEECQALMVVIRRGGEDDCS
jgi:hypothetical protein